MIIYLDYIKANKSGWLHDFKKYMDNNAVVKKTITPFQDDISQPYKLLVGAPKLVNVQGTYVEINKLTELCSSRLRGVVNRWIAAVNNPECYKPEFVMEFKWKRD